MSDIDPSTLSVAALTPADTSLAARLNAAKVEAGNKTAEMKVPGRRGRPPGSTNKPKEGKPTPTVAELAKIKREKQQRADELTKKIVNDANDALMSLLISQGLPASALYMPGQVPVADKANERFTPTGNRLAVKPIQAKAVANFIAEMEYSERGQKMTAAVEGGVIVQLITGGMAVAAVVTYGISLRKFANEFGPTLAAYNQHKKAQAAQASVQQQEGL